MEIKNIILGITGGIAAYKTPSLVRLLKKQGFNVKVILTENGKKFVTPLSLETVSQNRVYTGLFEKNSNNMEHISLSAWSDLVLIAPATANIIFLIMTNVVIQNIKLYRKELLVVLYLSWSRAIIQKKHHAANRY